MTARINDCKAQAIGAVFDTAEALREYIARLDDDGRNVLALEGLVLDVYPFQAPSSSRGKPWLVEQFGEEFVVECEQLQEKEQGGLD